MTDLEKARQDLAKAVHEKEVTEHQITRAENRLRNALKKQDSARTHRLIVEGAELEYVFEGIEDMPQNTFWAFMRKLVTIPGVMDLFEKMKSAGYVSEEGGDE